MTLLEIGTIHLIRCQLTRVGERHQFCRTFFDLQSSPFLKTPFHLSIASAVSRKERDLERGREPIKRYERAAHSCSKSASDNNLGKMREEVVCSGGP